MTALPGLRERVPGPSRRSRSAPLALCIAAGFAMPLAFAQTVPTPGAVADTVPQPRAPTLSTPAEVVFPRDQVNPLRDQTRRFLVSGFAFSGNTVFSEPLLRRLLERYLDLELTLAELDRIADVVTAFYRDQGFTVARAYVPAQRVEDGLVRIVVIEGRIDGVTIKNEGRYSKETLARWLAPLTKDDPAPLVTDELLERRLLLLNDLPGLRARATLVPGKRFGSTAVELDTQERWVGASLGFNNSGTKETGRNRADAGVFVNNPLGFGDQLSVRAIRSTDQLFRYLRLGYSAPLNADGLRLAVSHTATDYELGGDFAALGIAGQVRSADATLSYPFIRSRAKNVIGALQWRDTKTDQSVLGLPFSSSKLSLLTGSVYANVIGSDSSATSVNAALSTNAASKGSNSTTGEYRRFFKLDSDVTYLTGAGRNLDAYLRGRLVYGSTSLPDTEKYSLGGDDSVRGYPAASLRGDKGYLLTAELRRQYMVAGSPGYLSLFTDMGGVNNKGFAGYDRAASVGVGLTHYLGRFGQAKVEVAKPLVDLPGGRNPGTHVSFAVSLVF